MFALLHHVSPSINYYPGNISVECIATWKSAIMFIKILRVLKTRFDYSFPRWTFMNTRTVTMVFTVSAFIKENF